MCFPCFCVLQLAAFYCHHVIPPELPQSLKNEIAFIYFNNVTSTCSYFQHFPNLMLLDLRKSRNLNCNISGVEVLFSKERDLLTVTDPSLKTNQSTTAKPNLDPIYMYAGNLTFIFVIAILIVILERTKLYSIFQKASKCKTGCQIRPLRIFKA